MNLSVIIKILLAYVMLHGSQSLAQQYKSRFQLSDDAEIVAVTESVHPKEHKFDTCRTSYGKKLCRIDGELFFGTEALEAPRYKFKNLSIVIDEIEIPLETSGMYNPNLHHGDLRDSQFKLNKTDPGYELTGFFSDGIGTYIAKWLIVRGSAIRTMISNHDNDIDNQD